MTNKLIYLAALICIMLLPARAFAQTEEEEPQQKKNIVEIIEETSGNNIEVEIPSQVMPYVLPAEKSQQIESAKENNRNRNVSTGPREVTGFRIQIFSDGRNQATLRQRANVRTNAVLSRFPQYRLQVYSFSKAPKWYTRIGNFRTQREANAALAELRRAFPSFAGEMRVVRSKIVVVD